MHASLAQADRPVSGVAAGRRSMPFIFLTPCGCAFATYSYSTQYLSVPTQSISTRGPQRPSIAIWGPPARNFEPIRGPQFFFGTSAAQLFPRRPRSEPNLQGGERGRRMDAWQGGWREGRERARGNLPGQSWPAWQPHAASSSSPSAPSNGAARRSLLGKRQQPTSPVNGACAGVNAAAQPPTSPL
jgi:hypothetical protein